MKRSLLGPAALAGLLAVQAWGSLAPPALAQARDQDRAQSAVRSGEILPLRHILSGLRGRFPGGRVLDAQLRQDPSGGWRYDVKLLDDAGTVANVTVDGSTGRVISVR